LIEVDLRLILRVAAFELDGINKEGGYLCRYAVALTSRRL